MCLLLHVGNGGESQRPGSLTHTRCPRLGVMAAGQVRCLLTPCPGESEEAWQGCLGEQRGQSLFFTLPALQGVGEGATLLSASEGGSERRIPCQSHAAQQGPES